MHTSFSSGTTHHSSNRVPVFTGLAVAVVIIIPGGIATCICVMVYRRRSCSNQKFPSAPDNYENVNVNTAAGIELHENSAYGPVVH